MLEDFDQQLANTLAEIRSQGLYKTERIITSPQDAKIEITGGRRASNLRLLRDRDAFRSVLRLYEFRRCARLQAKWLKR